nr:immunoglobulin heavy chain junction region [Macaca mulatta]MOV39301.1 immunoglobulin heavy chain junction region [Macaca mulatta]MOV40370.1 immunoglobulin heavy chain junction region [Macaca mulatta]MOV45498.1 immunoglobulin heavy chain junction region [Macaca mulatta]MOV45597.1 immunoglobulin heavy chain junction region [Macaca mulatta]
CARGPVGRIGFWYFDLW